MDLSREVFRDSRCQTLPEPVFRGIPLPGMWRTRSISLPPSQFLWKICASVFVAANGPLWALLSAGLRLAHDFGARTRLPPS